jgi:hypothetical protein
LRCMVAKSVHMVVPESHSPSNCHSTMAISSERVPLLGLRQDGTIARPADCLSGLPLHCVQPPWDELQARYLVREFGRDAIGQEFQTSAFTTCGTRSHTTHSHSMWSRFAQGPTSARSQDQPDDATLCASFAGEFERGCERLGRASTATS